MSGFEGRMKISISTQRRSSPFSVISKERVPTVFITPGSTVRLAGMHKYSATKTGRKP